MAAGALTGRSSRPPTAAAELQRYTVRPSAFVAAIALLVLAACSHRVERNELLGELNETLRKETSYINILWYRGTSGDRHFVRHVYEIFGSRDYSVSARDLEIDQPFPYTDDSRKWRRIARIGGDWEASRKLNGLWVLEDEGIGIR